MLDVVTLHGSDEVQPRTVHVVGGGQFTGEPAADQFGLRYSEPSRNALL